MSRTEKHERDYGDAKVMIAEIRGDIKDLRGDMSNLKWQLGVIVAVLSTVNFVAGEPNSFLNGLLNK